MRKTAFIIMAMLASLGLLSACNNDDGEVISDNSKEEQPEIYFPIEEGEGYATISNFFNVELPSDTYSKVFFVDSPPTKKVGDKVCKTINSRNELEEIYSGDKDLPHIDFSQYTLIIGYVIMPNLGNRFTKQELLHVNKDNSFVIKLYVDNKYEYKPTAICPLYFWGLYPKFKTNNVTIDIVQL